MEEILQLKVIKSDHSEENTTFGPYATKENENTIAKI